MESCVAADLNKIDFTFLWTHLAADGPVAWLAAVPVAVVLLGVASSLFALAWRLVRPDPHKGHGQ
jgi:hypothetical protein